MRYFILFLFSLITIFLQADVPVDVVYTWVDGTDEAWLAKKKHFLSLEKPEFLTRDGHSAVRFEDREELKYSLRSILQFAPWVNHIYIVTAKQKPKWFKNHPLITFVSHEEIFKNQDYLPTFNSQAIEANLHHISGLVENFLYLNDDVFFGAKAAKTDFFTETGKIKVFVDGKMPSGVVDPKDGSWVAANKNTSKLLSELYPKTDWNSLSHTVFACKKSASYATEKKLPKIFDLVSSHKFRSLQDYAMTNGLIPHIAIQEGYGIPTHTRYGLTTCGGNAEKDLKNLTDIREKNYITFCVQDLGTNKLSLKYLKDFFEQYYPNPAPWEQTIKRCQE